MIVARISASGKFTFDPPPDTWVLHAIAFREIQDRLLAVAAAHVGRRPWDGGARRALGEALSRELAKMAEEGKVST